MNFKKNTIWQNIWLVGATLIVLIASIFSSKDPLMIISSVTGVVYTICIGFKDKYAYVFGLINVVLYGVVLLLSKTYAGAVYNLIYSAPMMIYGFFNWNKNKSGTIKELKNRTRLYVLLGLCVSVVGFAFLLQAIGGTFVWFDSATTCLGFIGIFLMTNMYYEQWWVWTVGNILNLCLWTIRTIQDISCLPLLVMWLIYPLNSTYAFLSWRKMLKKQSKNSNLEQINMEVKI